MRAPHLTDRCPGRVCPRGHRPALAVHPRPQTDGDRGAQQRLAERHHPRHSSDNEPGAAPEVPLFRRGRRPPATSSRATSPPGSCSRVGTGPTRADRSGRTSQDRRRTSRVPHRLRQHRAGPRDRSGDGDPRRDAAIAGVNADFFDIGDRRAPRPGRDRQRGLLHGRRSGHNSAFYIDPAGDPRSARSALEARVTRHPELVVTNLNSPFVAPGGIGIYDARWGRRPATGSPTARAQRADGPDPQRPGPRHDDQLPEGTRIRGTLLIGRGDGARALRRLKVGTGRSGAHPVRAAADGDLRRTSSWSATAWLNVTDDREMHPRTAVGIDDDTGEVLMLAIDGRQSFSRGYTLVELANLMVELGADRALNLDGGGSTTMVTERLRQDRRRQPPSDGSQRPVANALEVTYTPPA